MINLGMAIYGKIEEFNLYSENWDEYDERLSHHFIANKIDDAAILLSVVGAKMSPAKPEDKTSDELRALLKGQFRPKPLIIAEGLKF